MDKILIDGGLVVTMDPERRIIRDGAILIEGEKILAVGKSIQVKEQFPWTRKIDAREKVILPGFVDTHLHLSEHIVRSLIPDDAVDWMPNWLMPIYSVLTPEDEYWSAMLAFIELIRTGTTTFCEAGTCFYPERIVEAIQKTGVRGVLGRWTWDIPPGPERMRQSTGEALRANEDMLAYIRKLQDERISAWPLLLGMGTATDELVLGAKKLADDHRVGLGFMHASSIPSMETKDSIQPLSHFADLGVLDRNVKLTHMVYIEDHEIDLIRDSEMKISFCPSAAMKHCKGISRYGKFPEMVERGISVSLGADSANGSDHVNMLRIIHLTVQIFKDARMDYSLFPAETVLEMATLRGAEALLLGDSIGSIEPGKKADLVLFDRNHPEWRPLLNVAGNLAYAVTDRSIDQVFVSGKLILDQGRVVGVDEREVYAKVEDLSRRVMDRAEVRPRHKWPCE
jgi:cytosine/adenosine deaminase-related metal-dependent hydrolase